MSIQSELHQHCPSDSVGGMKTDRGRPPAAVPPGDLGRAYLQILCRRHCTASLARTLGVSTATAFRLVGRLRRTGYRIVSVKEGKRWFFELREDPESWRDDPVFNLIGIGRGTRRPKGESVDEVVYGLKRRGP